MSFKPNKSRFKVFNKPKASRNQSVKLPVSIAAATLGLTAEKISFKQKENKNLSDEESAAIDATRNRDTSSFYKEVFKRGINTLRPEILMTNEFSPITTGRRVQKNQNSISVQFGNDTFVEVTNTARLLELHQMLKENAINTSQALIRRYTTIPRRVDIVIRVMTTNLSRHISEIYDVNPNKMRKKLLEKTLEKTSNISIQNQINQLNQETLVLVSDFVMNNYVAKKLMTYIAKIFDFKESIESAIELNRQSTASPTVTTHNSKSTPSARRTTAPIKKVLSTGFLKVPQKLSLGAIFAPPAAINDVAAGTEGQKTMMPSKVTNFENFLDVANYLRSLVLFDDTIDDIENTSHSIDPASVMSHKKGRLNDAINRFKKISFPGCIGYTQRKATSREQERMIGDNISDAFELTGTDSLAESFAEIFSAMCYDQVAGATEFQREFAKVDNDLSNGNTFITITELFDQELIKKLNTPTYKRYFRNIKSDSGKVGSIVKKLFTEIQSDYDEKTFVPFETNNTIASDLYDNNEFFPGEEIFFTSALKAGDREFKQFEKFITDFKGIWEQFCENLIRSLGLDFDDEGKKSFDTLNTVDQLNPISYLNYYLNILADDLEASYIDSGTRRKRSIVNLALLLNNADSIDMTVSSFKSTLCGALINDGIGAPALLSDQNSTRVWIEDKAEGVLNTLYAESEAQVEKSFRRFLSDTIKVSNYPKNKRPFPNGGNYDTTLTATGATYPESHLGTFEKNKKCFLGVSESDHIQGEPDDNFRRYNYGHSGAADVELTKIFNLKVTNDWAGPIIAISIAILIIGTAGLGAQFLIAGQMLVSALSVVSGILAGTAAATAIGAGIVSAVTADAISKSNPVGIQLTSTGLFTFHTINNTALIINVDDRENLHMPNITEETISGISTFFFRDAAGNGNYDFIENKHPGLFGGLRKFSAVHRSFLFHYLAVGLLARTQRLRVYTDEGNPDALVDIDGPKLKISFKISRMRGLIAALRNEQISSTAVESEVQAYQFAKESISQIKRKIIKRKENILSCLAVIDNKISSLENTHKNLKNFLESSTKDDFKIVRSKLDEFNFFGKTASLLTPAYKDYLAKSYFQNYVLSSGRSSLFTKYDKDDLRDLKIMYRVLTTKNFGFLEKEKFGRKNVYHVGIPIGMIDYLKREAFKETADEDYLDSSLICITLHKNNQLNADIDYIPKQFIFDMSKHILPCTYTRQGRIRSANHIRNATDDKSLSKIINDMEVFIFNDSSNFGFKSNGKGLEGIVGNRTSATEENYNNKIKKATLLNHIFDYYLKMYTKLASGIEINESTFLLDSENSFSGQIDNQEGVSIKNQIYNRYLRDYPDVANDATRREIFSRSINLLSNSVLFSSNNRLKEMMSVNCFERVFSILVNDKDFTIDTEEEEENESQVFKTTPSLFLTPRLSRPAFKVNSQLGKNKKKIKSYIKESNEKSTSMSGFSIEVGILKKW
jgi:hypothetical protein